MARPIKTGLDYFSVDVDIFEDPKILFASDKYGDIAELVAIKMLTKIYRNGYYMEWNEEICLQMSKRSFSNMEASFLNNIVSELIKREFFDSSLFQKFGILTSRGIQKRWEKANSDAKRRGEIAENYNLLIQKSKEETPKFKEETPKFKEETPKNNGYYDAEMEEMQQKKRKESKGKEKKENTENFCEQKSSPPDFINSLIEVFKTSYKQSRGFDYIQTTKGKDREGIGKILAAYKKQNPSRGSDDTLRELKGFFEKCLNIEQDWHYSKMSPMHIASNMNEIKTILRKPQKVVNDHLKIKE